MEPFRLRGDLQRAVIGRFALPLGIVPGHLEAPVEGYTLSYSAGEDDEPDTYSFYVAVSHERVAAILHRVFSLLPESIAAIVEISSRDAYRQVDVFISRDEIPLADFLAAWRQWETVLLEDGSIGAGANSEQPFVEVFLDQWKGVSIIVPLAMRDPVEALLQGLGLDEVPQTWPGGDVDTGTDDVQIRPVLDESDSLSDIDDVLMELRRQWLLELNVDPDTNIDDAGRRLGMTLWHAVLGVHENGQDAPPPAGELPLDMSIWATAGSLAELEGLIEAVLRDDARWRVAEIYSTDRVAFDERPEELGGLSPRRHAAEVHLVSVERRGPAPGSAPGNTPGNTPGSAPGSAPEGTPGNGR
jgi:hypothetical protein